MKYLVTIQWINNIAPMSILGVCDTQEEAELWIKRKNDGMVPSGLGYDKIIPVEELKVV